MKAKPLVSIVMITYNHENFIKEAIEGVLMQQCTFNIELIISDDCSSDTTVNIIEELKRDHPKGERIKCTSHKLNKGMMSNFIWALQQARGKYTALCEGDDYWIDTYKLQKQVDFLEQNRTFSMCGAAAQCLRMSDTNREINNSFLKNRKLILHSEDFLSGYPVHTATVLFRTNMLTIPNWMAKVSNGDVTLFALLAEKGPVGFINEHMAVYRISGTGVWSSMSLEKRYYAFQNTSNYLNAHFKGKHEYHLRRWEFQEAKKVSDIYLNEKNYVGYLKFVLKNYHRYFWNFIWLPAQNQILNTTKQNISSALVKFRMYVGLRTRIKKFKNSLNNNKS